MNIDTGRVIDIHTGRPLQEEVSGLKLENEMLRDQLRRMEDTLELVLSDPNHKIRRERVIPRDQQKRINMRMRDKLLECNPERFKDSGCWLYRGHSVVITNAPPADKNDPQDSRVVVVVPLRRFEEQIKFCSVIPH